MADHLSTNHSPRVLIIGGGVGGLCLAQGLHRAGVPVAVFDRAASPVPDQQGYGFSINRHGDDALRQCLPPRLYELYRATASPAPTGDFVLFTSTLKVIFRKPLPPAVGVAVNRQTLREILLGGLGDVVQFGREYLRYEARPDGLVDAHFADGTVETGRLLVGADGTNSAVRAQLVPDAEFDDFGRSIYGKTPIAADLRAAVPPEFLTGMPRAKDTQGVTLGVGAFIKTEPFDQATARLAPEVRLSQVPDYLRWTLSLRDRPVSGRQFWAAHGPDLQHIAQDLIANWHPALRAVVEQADASATFPFGFFCARPIQPWVEPAITLLGDAIHTMTPGRGEGANTALRDAALLTEVLRRATTCSTTFTEAKRHYETEMLHYGFEAAENSTRPYFDEAMRRHS
ncbi:NAD(P)/FAD-dependent oxidoreductase [Frankia sp. Cr1]|uniref:FAD-dependent oxidoreductase n=1 Tax=Frankia sp. Cr1 TaxID=3073931 RepID=UPI002AD354ED|nr:NAD(P)/FAD-dependent oxidoreductase [Frankia sp. Cr1]